MKANRRDAETQSQTKFVYSCAEIKAKDKAELCRKINRRLSRGERVFSIRHMFLVRAYCYYEVFFESAVPKRGGAK